MALNIQWIVFIVFVLAYVGLVIFLVNLFRGLRTKEKRHNNNVQPQSTQQRDFEKIIDIIDFAHNDFSLWRALAPIRNFNETYGQTESGKSDVLRLHDTYNLKEAQIVNEQSMSWGFLTPLLIIMLASCTSAKHLHDSGHYVVTKATVFTKVELQGVPGSYTWPADTLKVGDTIYISTIKKN